VRAAPAIRRAGRTGTAAHRAAAAGAARAATAAGHRQGPLEPAALLKDDYRQLLGGMSSGGIRATLWCVLIGLLLILLITATM
jgi:hypothetical protein